MIPESREAHERAAPPLVLWGIVAVGVLALVGVWYLRLGHVYGAYSAELDRYYLETIQRHQETRARHPEYAWVVFVGRSDMDFAIPNVRDAGTRISDQIGRPVIVQKVILFSSILWEFGHAFEALLEARPDLIVVDYELLLEDSTLFRRVNQTISKFRAGWRGKPFRPHGGSYPHRDFIQDRAVCARNVTLNPYDIENQVQRMVKLRNLAIDRDLDGVAANLARDWFGRATKSGIGIAAVQLPAHPRLESARKLAGQRDTSIDPIFRQELLERFGAPVWNDSPPMSEVAFCDVNHMNVNGQIVFWSWLAPNVSRMLLGR